MANSNSLQLGNFVWNDKNGNGTQDAGELGIANVTVRLWGWNSATGKFDQKFSNDAKTDVNGAYQFSGMDIGSYRVEFVLPGDYVFTRQKGVVTDAKNSDANTSTGITGDINLDPQVAFSNEYVDAGMVLRSDLGSIGDKVWYDNNADGAQDLSEQGIANVTVKLYYADGTFIKQMQTDNLGKYLFTELLPTQYKVQFIAPSGHVFSPQDATVDGKDSDADRSTGYTADINLTAGGSVLTVDAGLYKPAAIGDLLWIDKNRNGQQDAGEAGLGGVTVTLTQGARTWTTVTSSVTGKEGSYLFDELPEGQFNVKFNLPSGYLFTLQDYINDNSKDSDVDVNGRTTVTLTSGQRIFDLDAGVYPKSEGTSAMLGNFVWRDVNADGVQDTSAASLEKGIGSVQVKLYNANGAYLKTTSTDGNGIYGFDELVPGNYYVTFAPQTGLRFSPQNSIADDTKDNDANSTGRTGVYTLLPGQVDYSVDAGFNALGSIGDTVWFDKFANGIQDGAAAGDVGMGQVKVDLYRYDAVSNTWNYNYKTTTTNGSGQYLFDNLPAAQYAVKVNVPTGYAMTLQNKGTDDAKDSDFDPTTKVAYYTLRAGEDVRTLDAGLQPSNGVLKGAVWLDNQPDPAKPVYATKADGSSLLDSDGNKILMSNADGIHQSVESNLNGMTVKLYDANWNLIASQLTRNIGGKDGQYQFDNLLYGKYNVTFMRTVDTQYTLANQGTDDSIDSDAVGGIATTTLDFNNTTRVLDAGLVPNASIGGKTFGDWTLVKEEWGTNYVEGDGLFAAKSATNDSYFFNWGTNVLFELQQWDNSAKTFRTVATTYDMGDGYNFDVQPGVYRFKLDWVNTSEAFKQNVRYNFGGREGFVIPPQNKKNLDGTISGLGNDARDNDFERSQHSPDPKNIVYSNIYTVKAGDHIDHVWQGWTSPIALDLDHDGIKTLAGNDNSPRFDLVGNGSAIRSGWLNGHDGFLAVDNNHNHQIDNINELFGGMHQGDGFNKLASFDSNGDGVVNQLDTRFNDLLIWQDQNENRVTDAGELKTLAEAGIQSLNVQYHIQPNVDAQGNLHLEHSSAVMADGASIAMVDVYFNASQTDAAAVNVSLPSLAELLSDSANLDALTGPAAPAVIAPAELGNSEVAKLAALAHALDDAAVLI